MIERKGERDDDAGLQWSVPLLQPCLQEPHPADLLRTIGEDDKEQELWHHHREQQRPLVLKLVQRCQPKDRARAPPHADGHAQQREEVPLGADAPPEAPPRQVAHAGPAVHGCYHEEGRYRRPEDMAERVREGLTKWPDVMPGQNRRQHDRDVHGIDHDQEGRHRMAGHQAPECGVGSGLLCRSRCRHDQSPSAIVSSTVEWRSGKAWRKKVKDCLQPTRPVGNPGGEGTCLTESVLKNASAPVDGSWSKEAVANTSVVTYYAEG